MIGILDSGVGGLSVLREVRALLPEREVLYVGDSAFCPYGAKSREVLQARIGGIVEFLLGHGASVIVLACNSATIQAVKWCRQRWPDVSFVGMEPGVKPAVEATRSKMIGVLATEASLTGEMFRELVERHSQDCEILTQACPKFVELVEQGILEGVQVEAAVREYGEPLVQRGVDVLVLGCTHYPFLKKEVARVFPDVHLVDTGAAVARRVADVCKLSKAGGSVRFFTSGEPDKMREFLAQLLPEVSGEVGQLRLDGDR